MTTYSYFALFVIIIIACPFQECYNREMPNILVNDRVRVWVKEKHLKNHTGVFKKFRNDTLFIHLDNADTLVPFPLGSVLLLEKSLGKKSNSGRGTIYGIVGGMVVGLTVGILNSSGSQDNDAIPVPNVTPALTMFGGGLLGAMIGAGLGGEIKTEHWVKVEI